MDSTPHIRLLALVRWQMFLNALRENKSRREELAMQIVLGIIGAAIVLGGALAMFGVVYASLSQGRLAGLRVPFFAAFFFWQFLTLLTSATFQMSASEIARYPIPFRKFALLQFAIGIIDGVSAAAVAWLFGAWVGVLFARPSLLPRVTLVMLVFVAVSLAISRVLCEFIEKWTSTRKGRNRLFAVIMLFSLGMQYFTFVGGSRGGRWLNLLAEYSTYLPPSAAYRAVESSLGASLAVLFAYIALATILLLLRYQRKYQGEANSDGRPPAAVSGAVRGWTIPGMPGVDSALFEKEMRYITSMPMGWFIMFFGPLVALAAVFGVAKSPAVQDKLFPGILAWVLMSVGSRAYNYFGMDAHGFSRYLLAPVGMRQVIWSKNLVTLVIAGVNFLGVWIVLGFKISIPVEKFATVLIGYSAALLIMCSVGNGLSTRYPIAFDYDKMRSKQTSSGAILGVVLTQFGVMGAFAVIFWFKLSPLLVFSLLAAFAGVFWWMSMGHAVRYVEEHSEGLAKQLIL